MPEAKPPKTTIQRTFITGMLVILPVLVTFWVVSLMFGLINNTVTPVILQFIRLWSRIFHIVDLSDETWVHFVAPLVSVCIAVLIIYLLGLVGGNVLGRQLLAGFDRLLKQVPLVRGIYSAVRQFVDTFSKGGSGAFRHVVLIEYPRPGAWTLAFVTNDTQGEVQQKTAKHVASVFVPTTPNPTSGFLLFIPEDEMIHLDMTVDDAFKMIISGGVLTPGTEQPERSP